MLIASKDNFFLEYGRYKSLLDKRAHAYYHRIDIQKQKVLNKHNIDGKQESLLIVLAIFFSVQITCMKPCLILHNTRGKM